MLTITNHKMNTGTKFQIITDQKRESIKFVDEHGAELSWDNNTHNQVLVSNMVIDLESEAVTW